MACYVWTDLYREPKLVGVAVMNAGDRAGEFQYAPDFWRDGGCHPIDPINLPFVEGFALTRANKGVFGVLTDAGPDAWGRRILLALHPKRMAVAGPLDVLFLASGHGVGALLFSESRTAVAGRGSALALADLGAAAEAAYQVEMGDVMRKQLELLVKGTAGLGGMHPKVAVQHDGASWIAKFRSTKDVVDTPRIEWATMRLAGECGIDAAQVELKALAERASVLVRRFDRDGGRPLHYASVLSLWNRASVNPADLLRSYSYRGIVEAMEKLPGCDVHAEARELFRRMVFNIIVGNTDDHERNHGFLMDAQGRWRLAPAFDVLPTVGAQAVSQAIGVGPEGAARSLENALAASSGFGFQLPKAKAVIAEVLSKVSRRFPALLKEANVESTERDAVMERTLKP